MNKWLLDVESMITSATAGMTEEQLLWHLEGKWSSAQILEHLSLAFSGTARAFERILAAGKPSAGRPSLKQRVRAFVVTGIGYFPPGRQSPQHVVPTGKLSGREAQQRVLDNLKKVIVLQEQVERQFGKALLADHPVLGPFTTWQWSRFHYVHTRHHMKQIGRMRRSMTASQAARA